MGKEVMSFFEGQIQRRKERKFIGELLNTSKTKEKIKPIGKIIFEPEFKDMIYEPEFREQIDLIVKKIKAGKEINLCFNGLAGTGKTTTAKMIATETNRPFVTLTGSSSPKRIVTILQNVKKRSIILIDEIHNLREVVGEIIYPAIQDKEIYFEGELIKLDEDMMFIGTTTDSSRMPKPLQERFVMLEFDEPSKEILIQILKKRGLTEATISIFLNHTQNIRKINQFILLCKVYKDKIDELLARKVFKNLKISTITGLSDVQEKYLKYLRKHKKGSLRSLAQVLRRPEGYIKNEVEPELMRKELIMITSKGRELAEQSLYTIENMERAEQSYKQESFNNSDREKARRWIKEHPSIKETLGKRYLELESEIAKMIHNNEDPDTIDWNSFADDIPISESEENEHTD